MKILVVTPQCPAPPIKGTTLRNYHLIKALADLAEVKVLSVLDPSDDPAATAGLEASGITFVRVDAPVRPIARRLRDLVFSRVPDLALRLRSRAAHELFVATLRDFRPDVVQFEAVEAAGAVGPIGAAFSRAGIRPLIVYDAHNVETSLQETIWKSDFTRPSRLPRAAYSYIQSKKLRRYEGRLIARSAHVLAVSEDDADALRELGASNVTIVPNGVDTDYYRPDAAIAPLTRTRPYVVFVGTLDFRPNIDAVSWFAGEVMPLLRAAGGGIDFVIVGRSPAPPVQRLAADDIDVVGPVIDERPWIAGAAAYVVPLRSGGGMRFKVVQAMASGVPVITTRFGAAGVAATTDHLEFAETAREFADAILLAVSSPDRFAERIAKARRLAVDTYDWKQIVPRLEAIFGSRVPARR